MVDSKIMNEIINILEENNYKFFFKGIYKDEFFYEFPDNFKLNCIKVQVKVDYEKELLSWFNNINMNEINRSKYGAIFSLSSDFYLLIEYVVDSHIIIPKSILKDFKSEDTRVYYINSKTNKIKFGSARKFNTRFGYYSLAFEEFLSKNYENNIGKIKKKIEDVFFSNSDVKQCNIAIEDIQNFLDSSLIRNPQFVLDVNEKSLSSKLIYKGYNTEFLMNLQNNSIDHLFKDFIIYLLINKTNEGLVLSTELFSNIFIKDNIGGIIVPLHPKYGIVMVEKNKKLPFSNDHYMIIEDINIVRTINKRIYLDCKKNLIDIVGIKEDLIKII